MTCPLWLADSIARLAQKAPGASRVSSDTSFADIPALTDQVRIPTRHGELEATVYSPPGGLVGKGVYVNFHGGGFVLRHPEQDDPLCRYVAAKAGVAVVNVDYTPAPQSRFPGPTEQAYDAAYWAASPQRPWDGSRLVLGGQSAGGALAAGAARLALERKEPAVALQVLMYPPLDLTISARRKKGEGKESFLVPMGPIFDTAYCPDRERRSHRLISPAGPTDTDSLDGIAKAVVVTAHKDILREEAIRYADRLAQAQALAAHLDLPDVGHGFNILGAPREIVEEAYGLIAEHTKAATAA